MRQHDEQIIEKFQAFADKFIKIGDSFSTTLEPSLEPEISATDTEATSLQFYQDIYYNEIRESYKDATKVDRFSKRQSLDKAQALIQRFESMSKQEVALVILFMCTYLEHYFYYFPYEYPLSIQAVLEEKLFGKNPEHKSALTSIIAYAYQKNQAYNLRVGGKISLVTITMMGAFFLFCAALFTVEFPLGSAAGIIGIALSLLFALPFLAMPVRYWWARKEMSDKRTHMLDACSTLKPESFICNHEQDNAFSLPIDQPLVTTPNSDAHAPIEIEEVYQEGKAKNREKIADILAKSIHSFFQRANPRESSSTSIVSTQTPSTYS